MLVKKILAFRYWIAVGLVIAMLLSALHAMESAIDTADTASEDAAASSSSDESVESRAASPAREASAAFGSPAEYRDLILLLDPLRNEISGYFLKNQLTLAIVEAVAPIIVSTNIFCNFFLSPKSFYSNDYSFGGSTAGLLKKGWYIFQHESANLVLLIPDAYYCKKIDKSSPLADVLPICGFNQAHLKALAPEVLYDFCETTDETISSKSRSLADMLKNITGSKAVSCISELEQMFLNQASVPTWRWNIYLAGHGHAVEKRSDTSHLLNPETAQITGLSYAAFKNFVRFLNGKPRGIQASFLAYNTCYGGGTNQRLINNILQDLDASFIVAGQGISDDEVSVEDDVVAYDKDTGWHRTGTVSFQAFFRNLHEFQAGTLLPVDPLKLVLQPLYYESGLMHQPSVKIPRVGTFQLVDVDRQVKILSKSFVRANELENNPIIVDTAQTAYVIVTDQHIGTDVHIEGATNTQCPKFVFPSSQTSTAHYQPLVYYFKHINCPSLSIEGLLSSFFVCNKSILPFTILIKQATCNASTTRCIPAGDSACILLENLIIHIDGNKLHVVFQCNDTIYEIEKGIYLYRSHDPSEKETEKIAKWYAEMIDELQRMYCYTTAPEKNFPGYIQIFKLLFNNRIPDDIDLRALCSHVALQKVFDRLLERTFPHGTGALAPSRSAERLSNLLQQFEKTPVPADRDRRERLQNGLAHIEHQATQLHKAGEMSPEVYTYMVEIIRQIKARMSASSEAEETMTDE